MITLINIWVFIFKILLIGIFGIKMVKIIFWPLRIYTAQMYGTWYQTNYYHRSLEGKNKPK